MKQSIMDNKLLKVELDKFFMKRYSNITLGNNGINIHQNFLHKYLRVFQLERILTTGISLISIKHFLQEVLLNYAKKLLTILTFQ